MPTGWRIDPGHSPSASKSFLIGTGSCFVPDTMRVGKSMLSDGSWAVQQTPSTVH